MPKKNRLAARVAHLSVSDALAQLEVRTNVARDNGRYGLTTTFNKQGDHFSVDLLDVVEPVLPMIDKPKKSLFWSSRKQGKAIG